MPVTGKIIKSIAGFYEVYSGGTIYRCRAKGVFRALKQKPLVGDDVQIDITDTVSEPKEGNVIALLPRRNDLIRPNVANVDQALLLFAITNPAPSCNMLDRFLISMELRGIPAILCFNKQDLAIADQIRELNEVYGNCGCRLLFISTRNPESMDAVREVLRGRTTVVTGPSGAGKFSVPGGEDGNRRALQKDCARQEYNPSCGTPACRRGYLSCGHAGIYLAVSPGCGGGPSEGLLSGVYPLCERLQISGLQSSDGA